jgi:hypothetical protein
MLACHRFVVLGKITQDYGRALLTLRFWRFFRLSAVIVAMAFVPLLVTRWILLDDVILLTIGAGGVTAIAVSLLVSLLFPAIAVDAPGASIRNAIADLWGNVWHIFWVSVIAVLPVFLRSSPSRGSRP